MLLQPASLYAATLLLCISGSYAASNQQPLQQQQSQQSQQQQQTSKQQQQQPPPPPPPSPPSTPQQQQQPRQQQSQQQQQQQRAAYRVGQAIPVSCLKRNIDTGEHIQGADGELQYIPFPTCNETARPLELQFGVEKDFNCTISFISDEFFHLLEFYVHNDAPLTCRIPARPLAGGEGKAGGTAKDGASTAAAGRSSGAAPENSYIPLIFSLSGSLQLSHLHIANNLNVLLHATPRSVSPGVVDSASAYSISPATRTTKIIIGASLPLRLSVRWYPTTTLPRSWAGVGGHIFLSTVVYCALSIALTAAACLAYFRAVELPRKLRRYGADRIGGDAPNGAGMRGGLGGYAYPATTTSSSSSSALNGHGQGFGHGLGLNFGRGVGKLD